MKRGGRRRGAQEEEGGRRKRRPGRWQGSWLSGKGGREGAVLLGLRDGGGGEVELLHSRTMTVYYKPYYLKLPSHFLLVRSLIYIYRLDCQLNLIS